MVMMLVLLTFYMFGGSQPTHLLETASSNMPRPMPAVHAFLFSDAAGVRPSLQLCAASAARDSSGRAAIAQVTASSDSDNAKAWIPVISAVAVLIAAIITAVVAFRSANKAFAAAERTLWQKANDDELKLLQKSLDEFYGPFLHISKSSDLMARDLRNRIATPGYRMLLYLMREGWFENLKVGDLIVEEVCKNGARLEDMIYKHGGAVDEILLEYLGRASVHFRMLNRALRKELGSDETTFALYVFPDDLTKVVELKVKLIQERSQYLRDHPGEASPPMAQLVIPKEWELKEWPDPKRTAEDDDQA